MNGELLRIVDTIHRDKAIDKEVIFVGIEAALVSAAKKHLGLEEEDIEIVIDRETGGITATDDGEAIDPVALGRIAAQAAKQVMIQKIREAERDVIFTEYEKRIGTLITGTVQRFEGPNILVNLGKTDAYLPKSEQMPEDNYKTGERIRALIFDVRKVGQRVKIILSRTHKDLVRRLFELEVPEINENVIEIKALAREAGFRTKIAVESNDPRVDPVGACVGVRGSRIKTIVEELNGEKIDIIRWSELSEMLIANALKPAEITSIEMDPETDGATVVVDKDQLSLAIGRRGQNVRLAAKLSGWHIDIVTESEERKRNEILIENLQKVSGVDAEIAQKIAAIGYASIDEILFRGSETLLEVPDMTEELATEVIAFITDNRDVFLEVPKPERRSTGATQASDPLAAAAARMLDEQAAAEQEAEEGSALDPLEALAAQEALKKADASEDAVVEETEAGSEDDGKPLEETEESKESQEG